MQGYNKNTNLLKLKALKYFLQSISNRLISLICENNNSVFDDILAVSLNAFNFLKLRYLKTNNISLIKNILKTELCLYYCILSTNSDEDEDVNNNDNIIDIINIDTENKAEIRNLCICEGSDSNRSLLLNLIKYSYLYKVESLGIHPYNNKMNKVLDEALSLSNNKSNTVKRVIFYTNFTYLKQCYSSSLVSQKQNKYNFSEIPRILIKNHQEIIVDKEKVIIGKGYDKYKCRVDQIECFDLIKADLQFSLIIYLLVILNII